MTGNHPHYLEALMLDSPMGDRLVASAERLLDEKPCEILDSGPMSALRSHQLPVLRNFSTFLMDFATSPENEPISSFCRVVLPPRTGKTVVAGSIIARTGLISTFVVPSKALVRQTSKELRAQIPGVPIGVFFGEQKNPVRCGVNVMTYSSLQRHAAQGSLPKSIRDAALVFLDEAHHAMTSLRMEALRRAFHQRAIRLALTATPDYDDHRRLYHFFPNLIHELDLFDTFVLGLLAPARMWVAEVDVDASVVRFVAGDYEQEMLGRLMSSSPFFKAVEVFRYSHLNNEMPSLISCASRQQAYDLWKYLKKHRPDGRPPPGLILGETSRKEREQLLDDFDNGRVDTLIQVGVLIEGWNVPHCKLLLDLAPSRSHVRATQKYFRVMTRFGDREARIYIILPKYLPRQPVLPVDLLLKPGDSYLCGDLLCPPNRREPRYEKQLDCHGKTPIKAVKIKQRILACASLKKPDLDQTDLNQIREVLESCPEFQAGFPCGRRRFQSLLFQHPLFTGSGTPLLRFLGVPHEKGAYWAFLAKLFPEQVGRRVLEENGGAKGELWCSCFDDFEYFEQAMLKRNNNGGKPIEPFYSTFRALCGGVEEVPNPEDLLIKREERRQILTLVRKLKNPKDRKERVLVQRFGLFGEPELTLDQIGEQFGVSRERIRQIIAKAIRILRYRFIAKCL